MPNFMEKTIAGGSQGATMGKVTELSVHLRVKHMILCKYNITSVMQGLFGASLS